jgi:hypothetical protein
MGSLSHTEIFHEKRDHPPPTDKEAGRRDRGQLTFFYFCSLAIVPDPSLKSCPSVNKQLLTAVILLCCLQPAQKMHAQEKGPGAKVVNSVPGKHQVGDTWGGGKIFWLDGTGQHGLIAASGDQSAKGAAWNPGEAVVTGANADLIYSGQANTEKIVGAQGNNSPYAAKLCADFKASSGNMDYNDWYLPSKNELNLLYQQKGIIGGFNISSGIYWSSTESTATPETSAWEQEFRFGSQHEDDKDLPDQVRCIRKF